MKFLVIGGAGFIGSNLARRFVLEGYEPIIIDDLSTGSRDNIWGTANFHYKSCSEIDQIYLPEIDGIFHLGIPSSTTIYRSDRRKVGQAVSDFIKVMELAKERNVKVVYASSSSIYNGLEPPYREDVVPKITDFYTEARLSVERLARLYHDFYGIKSIGLRLFSCYGPNEESKGNFANLITQALWSARNGSEFEVYGDGSQTRDYTYISDVMDAFELAMESDVECDVFNVGRGENYSLNELLNIMNEMGIEVKRKYVDNPLKNYVHDTLANTEKSEKKLGFKAKVGVREGIRRVYENSCGER